MLSPISKFDTMINAVNQRDAIPDWMQLDDQEEQQVEGKATTSTKDNQEEKSPTTSKKVILCQIFSHVRKIQINKG